MWKKPIVLAGLIALFGIGAAQAGDLAYARQSTYLRADPSSRGHVVASIPANTELSVGNCTAHWCVAHLGTRTGYVAQNLLDFDGDTGGTVVERTYVEPTYVEPTYVYPGYYPGPYLYGRPYWGGYGGWHGGWHGGAPWYGRR